MLFSFPAKGTRIRHEWTVTVTAPEGTLHEAFFDPVTVGTAVVADSANGVLKPAEFTDANGAAATIHRVAWEAGTERVRDGEAEALAPTTVLRTTPCNSSPLTARCRLSLEVADATVDSRERHAELDGGVAAVG